MMGRALMTTKPFHLMTPAERTIARIAQNRAISERIEEKVEETKARKPPVRSTDDYTRGTPDERSKLGSVIRKIKS